MKISELEGIIEGLLFVSGDPLSLEKIGDILELSKKDARLLMNSIVERINNTNRGIIIREKMILINCLAIKNIL
jgi:segregation and condensation protein B